MGLRAGDADEFTLWSQRGDVNRSTFSIHTRMFNFQGKDGQVGQLYMCRDQRGEHRGCEGRRLYIRKNDCGGVICNVVICGI